jgi:hypothetical protein
LTQLVRANASAFSLFAPTIGSNCPSQYVTALQYPDASSVVAITLQRYAPNGPISFAAQVLPMARMYFMAQYFGRFVGYGSFAFFLLVSSISDASLFENTICRFSHRPALRARNSWLG